MCRDSERDRHESSGEVQELRLSHQSDLLMVADQLGIGKVPSLHLPLELSSSGEN